MPFTPFHFGPGALIKSVIPKYFSFTLFVFTQVLMDLEPLYFILKNEYPYHRFFHTYIGACVVAIIVVVIGRPLCRWFLRIIHTNGKISMKCAILTGIIGTYSHVLLDSIMHADVKPFMPVSDLNPMLGIISLRSLHFGCLISGILGVVLCLSGKMLMTGGGKKWEY